MGKYAKYKEDLEKAKLGLESLENIDLSNEAKKETYDRFHKQASIANSKIGGYGYGKIYRFQTPKGRFYMVDIDISDIPELMRDLKIESYMYTEIATMKIIEL